MLAVYYATEKPYGSVGNIYRLAEHVGLCRNMSERVGTCRILSEFSGLVGDIWGLWEHSIEKILSESVGTCRINFLQHSDVTNKVVMVTL